MCSPGGKGHHKSTGNECHIQVTSWGYEDPQRTGFIKVNGDMIVDLHQVADNTMRGLHLVALQVISGHYQVTEVARFDLWQKKEQAQACVEYIDRQTEGTVIIGSSADEISKHLPVARDALESMGVDTSKVTYRSSLAFVAKKGDPHFIQLDSAEKNKGPTHLTRIILADPTEGDVGESILQNH